MLEGILVLIIIILIVIIIGFYSDYKDLNERYRELHERYRELEETLYEQAMKLFNEWSRERLEKEAKERALVLFEAWRNKYEKDIRRDAIEKSKNVIKGRVMEHFAPFFPSFPYNPRDARFIGSPIDLIVFDGLSDGYVREIVFVEVKSGTSNLSLKERLVRDAVEAKRVRWLEIRL